MLTVMDGGMGRELIRRGVATRSNLWSAQALIDAPQVVIETHRDYIAAGARMITTNSYSCVPSYLSKAGAEDRYTELAALAGCLARDAADQADVPVLVAGGLPPLSESYRPDMVVEDADARPIYESLAAALEPFVDLFLCETMSSVRESRNATIAARAVAAKRGLPVYVAWTLHEEPGAGLRSGESVADAYRGVSDLDIDGFLFNCTHPDAIEAGIEEIVGFTSKPTGGYPNRFDVPANWTLDNELVVQPRADFATDQFVQSAVRCIDKGATLLGGCCGIGLEDIAALSARVTKLSGV